MPSTSTVIVLPTSTGDTPSGVPVMTTSPGSSRVKRVMYSISVGMPKMKLEVRASCRTSPSTRQRTRTSAGSRSVSIQGPIGQNVSKPLPRVHWPSDFWRSRAVTSLPQV